MTWNNIQEGEYVIVTDRWQKFSDVHLNEKVLNFLAEYADEFLVHGVDVEGKKLVPVLCPIYYLCRDSELWQQLTQLF